MKCMVVFLSFLMLINTAFSQKSNIEYPKPGSVHPNAKYIDADRLFLFSKGAAVIRKGNADALIDSSGNFILNFNKFQFMGIGLVQGRGMRIDGPIGAALPNGIFTAAPPNGSGLHGTQLINSKGKVIYTAPAGYQIGASDHTGYDAADAPYMADIYSINKKNTDLTKSLDDVGVSEDGTVASFKNYSNYSDFKWGEGLYAYLDESGSVKKWGYKDRKGTVVIKPQYDNASTFSEGLAAVAKPDEFKEVKWGYINKQGTVVIPFKYSKRPGDFGDGLAVVVPKTITDFKYAFIDKTGEIKFTIDADSPLRYEAIGLSTSENKFRNGFIICNSDDSRYGYLMDEKRMAYGRKEILRWFGLNADSTNIQFLPFYNNQMYFENRHGFGLLNLKDRTILPAIFESLSMYDPVSNLAYAKLSISKDPSDSRKNQYIEGYINRQGVFVIVKKAATTW